MNEHRDDITSPNNRCRLDAFQHDPVQIQSRTPDANACQWAASQIAGLQPRLDGDVEGDAERRAFAFCIAMMREDLAAHARKCFGLGFQFQRICETVVGKFWEQRHR